MSDLLYPLAFIEHLEIANVDRVISDDFEAGNTMTRRLWAESAFRRQLQIRHSGITAIEYQNLFEFYRARGRYDSFWFRDNTPRRSGNYKVRFASPLSASMEKILLFPQIDLTEIAPIVINPDLASISTAVSTTPIFWYDANREYYHLGQRAGGTSYAEDWRGSYPLSYVTANNLFSAATQWQDYPLDGTGYGISAVNNTGFATGQIAATLFCFCKAATSAARAVLFATGSASAGASLGLELNASNVFTPFVGGTETWTGCVQSNATANTWRSIALTWAASSNSCTMYVNGASVGSGSNTRSLLQDKITMGADRGGAKLLVSGANLAHAMAFASALNLTQIKALHNLFAYQYGLANVS